MWAWSGYGHSGNLDIGASKGGGKGHNIIVSLSHKGDVETLAKNAFNNVNIVGAGGAGKEDSAFFVNHAKLFQGSYKLAILERLVMNTHTIISNL